MLDLNTLSGTIFISQVVGAVILGVLSHLWVFIHGEHHMRTPFLARAYLLLALLLHFAHMQTDDDGYTVGAMKASLVLSTYAISLLASIGIYRMCFHRLRGFPGPLVAGISKLWHVAHVLNSQNHLYLEKLYERYGEFVRTGPNEITIFNTEVNLAVNGPANLCSKAVWYDILLPLLALNTTRNPREHDQRRRIWNHAFTSEALVNYEARVHMHVQKFERHIADTLGEPVEVSTWFYFLSFDVMGDFAFAKSFKMLESERWHYAVILLRKAMSLLGPFSAVPWLFQLALSFPMIPIVREWNRMVDWCAKRMSEQIEVEEERPNISSWLINGSRKHGNIGRDRRWLNGDSIALIVAGSDTVAATMIYLFYRLALNPSYVQKLRIELDRLPSIYDAKSLKSLAYLNGVINETLRLHPSVPTGGYRETPPQGLTIAGRFIPGNTTIVAPRYILGRLETNYEQAEEFIPERWSSRPEMVKNSKAFTPFSIGRYACVGKDLALAEVRFVTALLVSKYDVAFAPGEDGVRVWKDMKDQFTAAPGRLSLVFSRRNL